MNFYSFASFKCEYFSFFSFFFSSTKLRPRGTRNDVYRCRQKLLNWTAKASRRNVVWIFPKETSHRRLFPCCLRHSLGNISAWTKSINKLPVVGFPCVRSPNIIALEVFVLDHPSESELRASSAWNAISANRTIGQYPFYWLLLFLFRRLYAKMLFRSLGCPYLMA